MALLRRGSMPGGREATGAGKKRGSPPAEPVVPVDPFAGDEQVRAFFDALLSGNWLSADAASKRLGGVEQLELALSVVPWDRQASSETIRDWTRARQNDRVALLVRAVHHLGLVWSASGTGGVDELARELPPEDLDHLKAAERDLTTVADLHPSDPLPWAFSLVSGRALRVGTQELCVRWDEVVARNPSLPVAHEQMLLGLGRAWGGSNQEMLGFARLVAGEVDDGSPLLGLVPLAHIACWVASERPDGYWDRDEVRGEITTVARRSVLLSAFDDGPAGVRARNSFAACFHLLGDRSDAALQYRAIGTRLSRAPWAWLGEPAAVYRDARTADAPPGP